jgi:hypothetical protein
MNLRSTRLSLSSSTDSMCGCDRSTAWAALATAAMSASTLAKSFASMTAARYAWSLPAPFALTTVVQFVSMFAPAAVTKTDSV